jgi:hypothetical protein
MTVMRDERRGNGDSYKSHHLDRVGSRDRHRSEQQGCSLILTYNIEKSFEFQFVIILAMTFILEIYLPMYSPWKE